MMYFTFQYQRFDIQNHLEEQQKFYKRFYNWNKKGQEWTNFLKGALRVKGL